MGLHRKWACGLNNVLDLVLGLGELLADVDHAGVVCHQLLHLQGHTNYLLGCRAALGHPKWRHCCPRGHPVSKWLHCGSVGERKVPPLGEVKVKRGSPPLIWPPL